MYQVLIVDDELPIREELQLFAFERLRCVICGQAENGQQALEFMQSHPVDIVLTDIRMPVMDGLRLIEKAKERFPDTQFILLSCINDFDPVKQALKMGVVDYILKGSYSDEELAAATLKAVSIIEERGNGRYERRKDTYRSAVRLLSGLVHQGEALSDVAADRLRELGAIGAYPVSVAWIDFCATPDETAVLVDELRAEYLSSAEFMDDSALYIILPGGCLVFLDSDPGKSAEALSALGRKRDLVDRLFRKTTFHSAGTALASSCFVPKPVGTDTELAGILSRVGAFHDAGFYVDQGAVCEDAQPCRPLRDVDVEEMKSKFAAVPIEAFAQFLDQEFRAFLQAKRIQKAEALDFVSGLLEDYLACRLNTTGTKELIQGLRGSGSLDIMIRGIIARLSGLSPGRKLSKCIAHAMHFINEDLSRPLSLSVVAEKIGISTSYLSSLFYRETGRQFNEYITERRMEMAMRLLRESSYKVYEVSEKVGIPSCRYFSKLFKEYTGRIPRDFR